MNHGIYLTIKNSVDHPKIDIDRGVFSLHIYGWFMDLPFIWYHLVVLDVLAFFFEVGGCQMLSMVGIGTPVTFAHRCS